MRNVDSISAQMLLREAYEISYYIYDHNRPDSHPWALCMHSPKEDSATYGPLHRKIASYRLRNIYDKFGLNLSEFLDCPREVTDLLLKMADAEMVEKDRSLEEIERELRNQ